MKKTKKGISIFRQVICAKNETVKKERKYSLWAETRRSARGRNIQFGRLEKSTLTYLMRVKKAPAPDSFARLFRLIGLKAFLDRGRASA